MDTTKLGWDQLLDGYPWFAREGGFPLVAYSEFMPPPRLARSPYGAADLQGAVDRDPLGWQISEMEEEYELRPGLDHVAQQIVAALVRLGQGLPEHHIAGHQAANLHNNPYWSPELARKLAHERYVVLVPLALSRTQDDMGRVRWTLFGGSEQGPERAFWKGFYTAPDQEWPQQQSRAFISQLLKRAYGEADDPAQLEQLGFRILPTKQNPADSLPEWTKAFVVNGRASFDKVRYLLTFRPFNDLPAAVRQRYLNGQLNLLPCPHSLVFWGMPTYRKLQRELPTAMQIPLLKLVARRGGCERLCVHQ